MKRRDLLLASMATACSACVPKAVSAPSPPLRRTRWSARTSEGFDAICFLSPLSGDAFYARHYEPELKAFQPRLNASTLDSIAEMHRHAKSEGNVLSGSLALFVSGGPDGTLRAVIGALDRAEAVLAPPLRASPYWSQAGWSSFLRNYRSPLRAALADLEQAGFPAFRKEILEPKMSRLPALRDRLSRLDVVREQERLIGRRLDPKLEVILLYFSKPHGIKIVGQRYLTHIDYPDKIVLQNAAHEIIHPPYDANATEVVLARRVLENDPLIASILSDKGRPFGYNSLSGYMEEDLVKALDQIVAERLGFADDPAQRWTTNDGGMHILAAGFYALLKEQGYDRTGGRIESWLGIAARTGKLSPPSLHSAASRVLKRPVDRLWPPPKA